MRYVLVLLAAVVFAACGAAPAANNGSAVANRATATNSRTTASTPVVEGKPSAESIKEFLLTSAAEDFHKHGPKGPISFRNLRMGHVVTPDGKEQYFLCGEVQPPKEQAAAEWLSFATVKTSSYEHWLGNSSDQFCKQASIKWDTEGDLSPALQSKLESMR